MLSIDGQFTIGYSEEAPPVDEIYVIDDGLTANNVLKYCINEMETVCIVGKKLDGSWYFASSVENPFEVQDHLNKFQRTVAEHIKDNRD